MAFLIVINKNGKELSRTELKKGEKPGVFGYFKGEDGNFYQNINDIRCITAHEQRVEAYKKAVAEFDEEFGVVTVTRVNFGLCNTRIFEAIEKVTIQEIKSKLSNYSLYVNDNLIILEDPRAIEKCPYHGLDRRLNYAKVVFDTKDKHIKIWDTNKNSEYPSMIILNALLI